MVKRIVVCCDGTWQNGISETSRAKYTNVLRLTRAITADDVRVQPPIPQIVYYQSGVGTDDSLYSRYVEGSTGSSLGDKVEEAYAFLAHNYHPGDEIFLFGFSRGAYTARMVAQFIAEIGVLDREDMDFFAQIFINYQTLGKIQDAKQKEDLKMKLAQWTNPAANGKKRAASAGKFSVKFLGVWDTVGALGLPGPFKQLPWQEKIFGFNDSLLGDHIERACQALALNETRYDFAANKLSQTDAGRAKNQYVKQVWFSGAHADIGGGYDFHDLSDISLFWMVNELDKYLSLDFAYLQKQVEAVAPWGNQEPHDPTRGIFKLAWEVKRPLPSRPNDPVTHEYVHQSVIQQSKPNPAILALVKMYPELLCPLGELEIKLQTDWPHDKNSKQAKNYAAKLKTVSFFD